MRTLKPKDRISLDRAKAAAALLCERVGGALPYEEDHLDEQRRDSLATTIEELGEMLRAAGCDLLNLAGLLRGDDAVHEVAESWRSSWGTDYGIGEVRDEV